MTLCGDLPRMPQHASVISGTSAASVDLGKHHQPHRVFSVDRHLQLGKQPGKAGANLRFRFAGQPPARDVHGKTVARQPQEAVDRRLPAAPAALLLMDPAAVMIDRNADRQPLAITPAQPQQRPPALGHRLHRIGQDQRIKAAAQRVFEHRRQFGVHERLAAGKADQRGRQPAAFDFIEVGRRFGRGQIGQPIILRRRLDIAMTAGKVTQRAGVEPQGLQPPQRHLRASVAAGGTKGILELARVHGQAAMISDLPQRRYHPVRSADPFRRSTRRDRAVSGRNRSRTGCRRSIRRPGPAAGSPARARASSPYGARRRIRPTLRAPHDGLHNGRRHRRPRRPLCSPWPGLAGPGRSRLRAERQNRPIASKSSSELPQPGLAAPLREHRAAAQVQFRVSSASDAKKPRCGRGAS